MLPEKMGISFYTEILSERIGLFVTTQWDVDELYTISIVAEMFGIDIRLARYYLMKFVDKGYLTRITWDDGTYYALRCWKGPFKMLGVKVL